MAKRTLLIVDDSPISRRMLRRCLPRDAELEVTEAGTGEEGLVAHQRLRPDITFLDLTMPGMNGFECLERIRAGAPTALVVVVTADVQRHSLARAQALGALEVIPKPPTPEAIQGALARAEARLREATRAP